MRLVLLLLVAAPGSALAAAMPSAPGAGGAAQAARVLAVLVLVLGLILMLAALLRRHGGMQRQLPGAIRVLAVTPLGARERLLLVQVGTQQLLLGASPGRIQTLLVLDEPLAPVEIGGGSPDFASQLRSLTGVLRGRDRS